ncbi:MAG TPA: hypothetical protein VEU07_03450, partial [Candidatus Acidoferrum sp.]|nr:hypothetical protein [Candidatus Acidoferrum sp.]
MTIEREGVETVRGAGPPAWREDPHGPRRDLPAASFRPIGVQAIPWLVCLPAVALTVMSGLAAPVGLWLKYDYLTLPLVVGGIAWWTTRLSRSATSALLALVVGSTLIVLFGTWQAGISDGDMIAGVFPYSDAQGYYLDALRLLTGDKLSAFSSRRPLFPVFLAGLLGLAGLNLRLVLVCLTGITALAIGLAARGVQRSLGPFPGTVFLLCLFMFYRRYIGCTMTEQLGLTLGCVAFVLLWQGESEGRARPLVFGLFFLSLALNARAGPFLILPAIVLWGGWVFRTRKPLPARMMAACLAAALLGFVVNGLLLALFGIPQAAFSNFAYVLYGLVFNGNWTLALQHHPELAALAPVEQADRIYALAWEQIRVNPRALLDGCIRAWTGFFFHHSGTWSSHILNPSPAWSEAVVQFRSEGVAAVLRGEGRWIFLEVAAARLWSICLNVLLVTGVIVAWRNRRQPLALLSLFGWAGILLSVPFAPPWDADSMRVYAATLPFILALPSLGLLYDI